MHCFNSTKRLSITLTLVVLLSLACLAQVTPKRSTISQGGIQKQAQSTQQVQQSVGQGSVIGTFQSNSFTVSQGFIQPTLGNGKTSKAKTTELHVKTYPNPVVTSLYLEFDDDNLISLDIELSNILGKVIYLNQFTVTRNLEIDLNWLSGGIYFIKIRTSGKEFTTKLVKE